jgi:MFS family permease
MMFYYPSLFSANIQECATSICISANIRDCTMLVPASANDRQALPQWQEFMGYPTGAWLGFINAISAIGSIFGLPFQAWTSNKYGRKMPLYVGTLICVLGTGLQVGAQNPATFIVSRAIIGHGTSWMTVAPLLVTETAYPTHRSKLTAMYK